MAKVGPRPMLLVGTLGLTASFVWLSTLSTTSTYAAHLLGALVQTRCHRADIGQLRLQAHEGRFAVVHRPSPGARSCAHGT